MRWTMVLVAAVQALAAGGGPPGPSDPTAYIVIRPNPPVLGEPFMADGRLSFDRPAGDLIASYLWEWGDCTPSGSGVLQTHTYTKPGVYLLSLTVADTEVPPNTDTAQLALFVTGDVNLRDFAAFQNCYGDPDAPPAGLCCAPYDFDIDGDIDLNDYGQFVLLLNGP